MRRSSAITTGEPSCAPTELDKPLGGGLQLLGLPSAQAVAHHAAELLLAACQEQPRRPLGLATGRTMAPIYAAFSALVQERPAKEQETL
ncbi:MAG: hypothetical protein VKN56_13185, partial [Cyanobacteriota bacterium]|nr:hypothetical protein [Cyanobacteriota bacterium]